MNVKIEKQRVAHFCRELWNNWFSWCMDQHL